MVEENINQEFRQKNIDELRNYLIEQINRNVLISKKHKKVSVILHYVEQFFILQIASAITERFSISAFTFLIGNRTGIKKYKSIVKKKKKMLDNIK